MTRVLYSPDDDCVLFDTRDLTPEQLTEEFGAEFVEVGRFEVNLSGFPLDQILKPE